MQRLTELDRKIASGICPILIEIARRGDETVTYGNLIELTKTANPNDEDIQRVWQLGFGRRLDALRILTEPRSWPDLSSLVVGKVSKECGRGFPGHGPTERKKVWAFDWSSVPNGL